MDSIQKEQILNEYCANEMQKLKQICYPKIGKIGGISQMDYDDLYSIALDVLRYSIERYDSSQDCKFSTYLSGNIDRKFATYVRDKLREKRSGEAQYDEDGNRVFNQTVSLDDSAEDGTNLNEKIASDFKIEDNLSEEMCLSADERVDEFLEGLSKKHRNILKMKMNGFSADEIKTQLGLSNSEYNNAMKSMKMNENLSMFTRNINDGKYEREVQEMETNVMEIEVSDNYRMDKYSMFSLLEDKKNSDINCKYILQRKPFQWTPEEVNRFIARILNNLPIPEIIICEQRIRGMLVSHLIDGLQRLSYAEAFKENRIKIGEKGAERRYVKYKDYQKDENGNRIFDEEGLPVYEVKTFDIVGKKYSDLPEDLQRVFNKFNINVTKFFDCTDQQIADHIRDYNNHASMNKEQGGITKITTDTAGKIKNISDSNVFFKNCGKFTDTNKIKGKLDRIVAETLMLLFFRDDWKSKVDSIYQFIDKNAVDAHFDSLNSDLNRLECAIGDDNKEFEKNFTVAATPMWLAVYHKFTEFGLDDSKFIGFLRAYNDTLKDKTIDGVSMDDFKDEQTKKKSTITGKIDLLVKLMTDYLHIEAEENQAEEINNISDERTQSYISEFCKTDLMEVSKLSDEDKKILALESLKVTNNVTDDALIFADSANEWLLNVENGENLIIKSIVPALIGFVGYLYANNYSDEEGIALLKKYLHTTSITNSSKVNLENMIAVEQKGAV